MSQSRTRLLSYALRLLNLRERFSGEVENKLYLKAEELKIDDPIALIDQIIFDLKKINFLDDKSFLLPS
jgi:SOS response regulatory protein OraA/RecX